MSVLTFNSLALLGRQYMSEFKTHKTTYSVVKWGKIRQYLSSRAATVTHAQKKAQKKVIHPVGFDA